MRFPRRNQNVVKDVDDSVLGSNIGRSNGREAIDLDRVEAVVVRNIHADMVVLK